MTFKEYEAVVQAVQALALCYEALAKYPPMHGQDIKTDLEGIASNASSLSSQLYFDKPKEPETNVTNQRTDTEIPF